MDLKQFIKETLIQISNGVKEAQESVREQGGYVNPAARVFKASDQTHFITIEDGQNVFLVDFNVAVTVTEEEGKGAHGKLKVASFFDLGAEGNKGSTSSVTNRLSFKVPLALPVDEHSKYKLLEKEKREAVEIESSMSEAANGDW